MREAILLRLEEILTYEAIDNQISSLNKDSYWYNQSYRQFIKRFKETRGEATIGVWAERVALVYSWLPKIPLKSFALDTDTLQGNIDRLSELESIFYDAELSTIGRTAYLGSLYHGETIFSSYKGYYDTAIREFLIPAGFLIHKQPNLDTQLSSITKLLHFMCPYLFPIFDTKVCKQLFDATRQTYERYHMYVFGLQEFLQRSDVGAYVLSIADKMDLSPLYIIDLVIFNAEDAVNVP
ncbi:hypothetical protein [Peribacillus tepidiphilus]|jgi:hypothetical protein|uniref:hypothetical protein n=1 Tax=Peribacillus tepidiphilus TaxID=2652445 RepID=UPI0035B56CAA